MGNGIEEHDSGGRECSVTDLVRDWRTHQLMRLGLPRRAATAFADIVEWREVEDLVRCGCPLPLALRIAH
jgi:hypothetical protein